jgi:phosphoheptose isomerase
VVLTAIANDRCMMKFTKQVRALGHAGDVLLASQRAATAAISSKRLKPP